MVNLFKANDVALAAMEIEKRGEAFYLHLADQARDTRTRKLFEYLATEETKHRESFQALYERLGEVDLPAWSNEKEFLSYLNALIDTHALFQLGDAETLKETIKTRKDAIQMAMQFEKETMLFFMELREFIPESEKKVITACIEEERNHLRQLNELL